MGALANGLDGGLGSADEAHDLAVLELGMVAHEPKNRVRPILSPRNGGIPRPLFLLCFGQSDLGVQQLEAIVGINDPLFDLLAAELSRQNGIEPFDSLRSIAVGDCLYFERVE